MSDGNFDLDKLLVSLTILLPVNIVCRQDLDQDRVGQCLIHHDPVKRVAVTMVLASLRLLVIR